MPIYEAPKNLYHTPPEVIEADWGKESIINGAVSMIITMEIDGDDLTETIIHWALAVFFMKAAFTTSLPNPFIYNIPYSYSGTRLKNKHTRFQIIYPDTSELQRRQSPR